MSIAAAVRRELLITQRRQLQLLELPIRELRRFDGLHVHERLVGSQFIDLVSHAHELSCNGAEQRRAVPAFLRNTARLPLRVRRKQRHLW